MLPEAKLTVSLVVDGFGAFTTGLLQWFVAPYVLRMRMVDEHTVAVDKLTLFARTFEERFPAAMVEARRRDAAVTWEAEGYLTTIEMARSSMPSLMRSIEDLERFDRPRAGGETRQRGEGAAERTTKRTDRRGGGETARNGQVPPRAESRNGSVSAATRLRSRTARS